jgi:hypothetical protein
LKIKVEEHVVNVWMIFMVIDVKISDVQRITVTVVDNAG